MSLDEELNEEAEKNSARILKFQRFVRRKLRNLELYSLISMGVFASVFVLNKINCSKSHLELKTENVIGNDLPEKFYEINGKKVYLEIDGKPVEKYFEK